ncbi:MAG: PKD domain-containing protein, partial [Planctomycetaceae bacterium]|nr:PKD domain-containing protein [Planctomycetaceae bacterium]
MAAALLLSLSSGATAVPSAIGPTGVTATLSSTEPEVGAEVTFTAAVTGQVGLLKVSWSFGDGSIPTSYSPSLSTTYTYQKPGHFTVTLRAQDSSGDAPNVDVRIIVHHPVAAVKPTNSSTILLDGANQHLWVVNPDQDT